jgi:hypothetical protein
MQKRPCSAWGKGRSRPKFSGLVGAHGSEEETTFLATQQVDEARHMQFYARFQDADLPLMEDKLGFLARQFDPDAQQERFERVVERFSRPRNVLDLGHRRPSAT